MTEKNDEWDESRILSTLIELKPRAFEKFVRDLWSLQGWDAEVTARSGDKGIDVIATQSFPYEKKVLIQAKKNSEDNNIGGATMQKYASLKQRDNVDEAIIVTTGRFTPQAKEIGVDFNLKIVSGPTLAQLVTDLSAEHLVEAYAEKDGEEQPTTQPSTTDQSFKEALSDDSPAVDFDRARVRGACEDFQLELLGYEYVRTDNPDIGSIDRIEGFVLAFELLNNADREIELFLDDIVVISDERYSYDLEQFVKTKYMPENWQSTLPSCFPKTKAKFAGYIPSSSEFEIAKIRYSSPYQQLLPAFNGMPDDVPSDQLMEQRDVEISLSEEERSKIESLPPVLSDSI
ncbi:restriction endonuclease [Halobacterium salinarum]|uniref:restriction endonuclease n=1 Tax=Halobacterium salinarum TaxID=2242 RepID=UPI002554A6DF|nr:restriction endonuclease [Halobacterium salinarum]MDL0138601.1 restriction endonuclease [Halobacterium salinarum]